MFLNELSLIEIIDDGGSTKITRLQVYSCRLSDNLMIILKFTKKQ